MCNRPVLRGSPRGGGDSTKSTILVQSRQLYRANISAPMLSAPMPWVLKKKNTCSRMKTFPVERISWCKVTSLSMDSNVLGRCSATLLQSTAFLSPRRVGRRAFISKTVLCFAIPGRSELCSCLLSWCRLPPQIAKMCFKCSLFSYYTLYTW